MFDLLFLGQKLEVKRETKMADILGFFRSVFILNHLYTSFTDLGDRLPNMGERTYELTFY